MLPSGVGGPMWTTASTFARVEKLGFRYSHDELYEPTGLMHCSYLLGAGPSR